MHKAAPTDVDQAVASRNDNGFSVRRKRRSASPESSGQVPRIIAHFSAEPSTSHALNGPWFNGFFSIHRRVGFVYAERQVASITGMTGADRGS